MHFYVRIWVNISQKTINVSIYIDNKNLIKCLNLEEIQKKEIFNR
jgi:hypothetical protein